MKYIFSQPLKPAELASVVDLIVWLHFFSLSTANPSPCVMWLVRWGIPVCVKLSNILGVTHMQRQNKTMPHKPSTKQDWECEPVLSLKKIYSRFFALTSFPSVCDCWTAWPWNKSNSKNSALPVLASSTDKHNTTTQYNTDTRQTTQGMCPETK